LFCGFGQGIFSESKDFSQDSSSIETPIFGTAKDASEVKFDSFCHLFLSICYHYTTEQTNGKGFFTIVQFFLLFFV